MRVVKLLKIALFLVAGLLVAVPAAAYTYLYVLPKGPELTAPTPTPMSKANLVLRAHDGAQHRTIRVWTYRPANWQAGGDVLFVMHGMSRNAEEYLDTWIEAADRKTLLLVAPEFDNPFYRYVTNDYQDGNLFTALGLANPRSEWAYATIERIVDHLNSANGWTIAGYDMFGHSAGGQFVQKLAMLAPESRLRTGIAANPGSYTFPASDIRFPYGLKGVDASAIDLGAAFRRKVIILLGEKDADADQGVLDQSEPAMQQGPHRLARGQAFFAAARAAADAQGLPFEWRVEIVPGVGHENAKMAAAAADLL
jgi:pimeloyl-ACP methyl ester carboxylesterase